MDWAATIPEIPLAFLFPGAAPQSRLLRLPGSSSATVPEGQRTEAAVGIYRFRRLMEVSIWRQSLTLLLVSLVFVWLLPSRWTGPE